MKHTALRSRVYDKTIHTEYASETYDSTPPHSSFTIFICQKKVKKICNFLIRVFFKTADIRSEEKYRKHETVLQELFIGRDNVNLLLREVHAVTFHTIQRHQKVLFFLFQVFCFCVFCRYRFGKLFLQYSCCLYVGFLISALS